MLVGAHVPGEAPLKEAEQLGAACVQMFVGDPQSYKKPPARPDAAELLAAQLPIYVHAPYRINVASPNNRIRIPSRKLLAQILGRAEEIGAAAVIVHGGHSEDGIEKGFVRWRKAFEENTSPVPIMIENTAGGTNAMARQVDVMGRLFQHLEGFDAHFCFDTCHAHAAGEDLDDVIERTLEATGRIDLVHANSSKDAFGSGRDRHSNFAGGVIDPEAIIAMVRVSGAPAVICETAWPGIGEDMAYLTSRL